MVQADYSEILEKVRCYALAAVKPERYEHSIRTAETASLLCEHYGEKKELGYLAGIAHDMCKDMDDTMRMQLASQDGDPFSDIEKKKTSLVHGRSAAVLLQKQFGVTDFRILDAVRFHTFGSPDMCALAKILYVADKIEPGRPHMNTEKAQEMLLLTLDNLVFSVLKENIDYLEKRNKDIALETLLLYTSLKKSAI